MNERTNLNKIKKGIKFRYSDFSLVLLRLYKEKKGKKKRQKEKKEREKEERRKERKMNE